MSKMEKSKFPRYSFTYEEKRILTEKGRHINSVFTSVVLQNLFSYFELEDLKQFRLVCTRWKDASDIFFRKRCRIVFSFVENFSIPSHINLIGEEALRPSAGFVELKNYFFNTIFHGDVPFAEVEFKNFMQWNDVIKLRNRMHETPWMLNHVKTNSVTFVGDQGRFLTEFDVTPLIAVYGITQLNLDCKGGSRLIVPLRQLTSIQDLKLSYCTILINNQEKIRLRTLELNCVKLKPTNESADYRNVVFVNDFIDFLTLSKLKLVCLRFEKNMGVNLSDYSEIAEMDLTHTHTVNHHQCAWELKKLVLESTQLPLNYSLKIKDLAVSHREMDFNNLPLMLERLTLGSSVTLANNPVEISLPHLKYLRIREKEQMNLLYVCSRTCPNLQDVNITLLSTDLYTIFLDQLPKSVRRMKIAGNIRASGNGITRLEKLILCPNTNPYANNFSIYFYIEQFTNIVSVEHLVIQDSSLLSENLMMLLTSDFSLSDSSNSLTVGTMLWEERNNAFVFEDFSNSPIAAMVDIKAKYYVFKQRKGKSISEKLFHKMCEF